MDSHKLLEYISKKWEETIIPTLEEYITIPNQSPAYDKEWETNGLIDKAAELLANWSKKQNVENLHIEILKDQGKTPIIFMELPATKDNSSKETVLLYGHLDKQPPLTDDWEKGLHPYKPVIKDGKLYGRGGADDGYSTFAAVTCFKALQENKISHGRMVVIIEASEESGSPDLPHYISKLKERLGELALIVCLDSGCGNYEQFWTTTSLRGIVAGTLKVSLLKEAVHSGAGTGIYASSFRVIRELLDRIEDSKTGKILLEELFTEIPKLRIEQAEEAANYLKDSIYKEFSTQEGVEPITKDLKELLLNKTWRPTLAVTGADGFPAIEKAGNVLRKESAFKLSFRIPPGVDPHKSLDVIHDKLTHNPPYKAQVVFRKENTYKGWQAPIEEEWLINSVKKASEAFYGKPPAAFGEGGSIPFMGMLGDMFPKAQFVVTGLLGPKSNAHGPNEFLEIGFAKKLNACIVSILHDFNHNRHK